MRSSRVTAGDEAGPKHPEGRLNLVAFQCAFGEAAVKYGLLPVKDAAKPCGAAKKVLRTLRDKVPAEMAEAKEIWEARVEL